MSHPTPSPPALDLHPWCHDSGGDVAGALHATRVFLLGQLAMGSGEVHVIHGKGQGRLRDFVKSLLDEYKTLDLILDFYIYAANPGVTIIKLPTGRKAREALKDDPYSLRTKPFEELSDRLRKQLNAPPPPVPAPIAMPVIDGETRLSTKEFATLEQYAQALVQQRSAEVTPPSGAPRKLKRGAMNENNTKPLEAVRDGYMQKELDELAREARAATPQPRSKASPSPHPQTHPKKNPGR